jgi:transposase InsO family protein
LTIWDDATPMNDCSTKTVGCLLFEHVVTRFGCPRILMSDHGTHFINSTIQEMLEEFEIHHQEISPYHPRENGTVEAFNKILENAFTNICNVNMDD